MQQKTVAIIGIGRVGLPLALVIAEEKYKVYGIGRDSEKIDLLKKGVLPFVEKGATKLKKLVNKTFLPTTSYDVISDATIVILTLGTPIDENMNPILEQIDNALEQMMPYLHERQLIILRSTVSPGTTKYVKEKIEQQTKLKIGKTIFLAYCPERIAEGDSIKEIREIPQIIGGIEEESSKQAKLFFESLGVMCLLSDDVSVELAKLFTNMYRYISFAIANEFMYIAEDFNRNIHEIVSLVNTGYKRGGLALPGLTAGPCLFKDGFFLINENPFLDLITASWKINEGVPLFLIKKLREKGTIKNKKVAILGLSFKPEIDDIRESLSFKLRKALLREHAIVTLHDPFVKKYSGQEIEETLENALNKVDILILAVNHKEYIMNKEKILGLLKKNTYVCDIWNIFGTNKLLFRVDTTKRN